MRSTRGTTNKEKAVNAQVKEKLYHRTRFSLFSSVFLHFLNNSIRIKYEIRNVSSTNQILYANWENFQVHPRGRGGRLSQNLIGDAGGEHLCKITPSDLGLTYCGLH
jgi:hypothetical protein